MTSCALTLLAKTSLPPVTKCRAFALVATIYVIVRFVEAYGLWYIRPWAEWLAIASGSIYIPFEVADLLRKPDLIRLLIIVVNVGIVLYMVTLRLEAAKKRHAACAHP